MKKSNKHFLIIGVLLFTLFLTGCNKPEKEEVVIDDQTEVSDINSLEAPFKATAIVDIEIHNDHTSESSLVGYVRAGDRFEVYELYEEDNNSIWCRIGNHYWINNQDQNQLELIPYETDINVIHDVLTFRNGPDIYYGYYYERYNDGVPIEFEREYADSIENEYDTNGRLICEILHKSYGTIETYKYEYDANCNIINAKATTDSGFNAEYSFTFDDKNRLLTESTSYSNITHVYDEYGNIVEIFNNNHKIETLEYNGNICFQNKAEIDPENEYTKDTFVTRYDNNSILVEEFKAWFGDIRNDMGPRK